MLRKGVGGNRDSDPLSKIKRAVKGLRGAKWMMAAFGGR